MAKAKIADDEGRAAVEAWREQQNTAHGGVGEASLRQAQDGAVDRQTLALAVRWTLQLLAERAAGNTVEVRVPPFGAVQCIEGPRHTRGTPPNVIETDAATWLALATGAEPWDAARATGRVHASGQRADLAGLLPLTRF